MPSFLYQRWILTQSCPGSCIGYRRCKQKWGVTGYLCSPDKERPGHKWINCLEVTPFSPQMFFFFPLYNGADKSFTKTFVPVQMCLQPVVSLRGTNTRANLGLGFRGNSCLTLSSDITLSWYGRKNVPAVVLFFGTWEAEDHISALAPCFCWPLGGIWLGVPNILYSKTTCRHESFFFFFSAFAGIGLHVFSSSCWFPVCCFFQEKLLHRNDDFHTTEDIRRITQRAKRSPGNQPDTGMSSIALLSLL